RQWAERLQRQAERRARHFARHAEHQARRFAREAGRWARGGEDEKPLPPEEEALRRARRRAAAEAGFYAHLVSYLSVIAFLALINLFTSPWYPWFLWPAFGWGIGLFSHYMAVFGSRALKERFFDPATVAVSRNYVAGPTVQADADKLRGVFANLLDNAIDALASVPEGRRIDLFLDNGAGAATVRVRDNGCGIPADKLDRIFNPF